MKKADSPKPDPLNQKSYKSCCWYGALVLVGLPILLVALGVSFVAFSDRQALKQVEEKLASLKEQGIPTDGKSLKAQYLEQTDPKNTADWMEIFGLMKTEDFRESTKNVPVVGVVDDDTFPPPGAEWQYRENVARFLSKHRRLTQRIQRLSLEQIKPNAKYVQLPVEMDGIATLLEPWQDMRSAARMLQLSGLQAIDRRDSTGLRRDIMAAIGCSEVASPNICMVTELIHLALAGMALELVRDGLEHDVLTTEDIETLMPYIEERCVLGRNWRSAVQAERAIFGLYAFDSPERVDERIPRLPFRGKDKLKYITTMQAYIDAPLDDIDSLLNATGKVEESFDLNSPMELFNHAMSQQLVPAGGSMAAAESRLAAKHRMIFLAMHLKLYEAENGKYPTSLEELDGIDLQLMRPGGGKPFGYLVEDGEAMIWFDFQHRPTPAEPPALADGEPDNAQVEDSLIRLKTSDAVDGESAENKQ